MACIKRLYGFHLLEFPILNVHAGDCNTEGLYGFIGRYTAYFLGVRNAEYQISAEFPSGSERLRSIKFSPFNPNQVLIATECRIFVLELVRGGPGGNILDATIVHSLEMQVGSSGGGRGKETINMAIWCPADEWLVVSGTTHGSLLIGHLGQGGSDAVLQTNRLVDFAGKPITCLAFGPPGLSALAVGGNNGSNGLYDISSRGNHPHHITSFGGYRDLTSLAFAPANFDASAHFRVEEGAQLIALASKDGQILLHKCPPFICAGAGHSEGGFGKISQFSNFDKHQRGEGFKNSSDGRPVASFRIKGFSQTSSHRGKASSNARDGPDKTQLLPIYWSEHRCNRIYFPTAKPNELAFWELRGDCSDSRNHVVVNFTSDVSSGIRHTSFIYAIAAGGPKDDAFVTLGKGKRILIHKTKEMRAEHQLVGTLDQFNSLAMNNQTNVLFVGCGSRIAFMAWNLSSVRAYDIEMRYDESIRDTKVNTVVWHPENYACFATERGQVGQYRPEVARSDQYRTIFMCRHTVNMEVALSDLGPLPDSGTAELFSHYYIGGGGKVFAFALNDFHNARPISVTEMIPPFLNQAWGPRITRIFRWSPNKRFFAVGDEEGRIGILQITNHRFKCIADLETENRNVTALAFHPFNDEVLAVGSHSGKVFLFDLARIGEFPTVYEYHRTRVMGLAWANERDQRFLASAGSDGFVHVMDVHSRQLYSTFAGHRKRVLDVCFSPHDINRVISMGEDSAVMQWRVGDHRAEFGATTIGSRQGQIRKKVRPDQRSRQLNEPDLCPQNGVGIGKFKPMQNSERRQNGLPATVDTFGGQVQWASQELINSDLPDPPAAGVTRDFKNWENKPTLAVKQLPNWSASRPGSSNCSDSAAGGPADGSGDARIAPTWPEIGEDKGGGRFEENRSTELGNEGDDAVDFVPFTVTDELLNPGPGNKTEKKRSLFDKSRLLDNRGDPECVDLEVLIDYHLGAKTSSTTHSPGLDQFVHLGLYCGQKEASKMAETERLIYEESGNDNMVFAIELFRNSTAAELQSALGKMAINDFMLAMASSASLEVWQWTSREYAKQLIAGKQFQKAAACLLAVGDVQGALEMLVEHECYRDAAWLARYRLGPHDPLLISIYETWIKKLLFNGHFVHAAKCHIAIGQYTEAAKLLARRTGALHLFVACKAALCAARSDASPDVQEPDSSVSLSDELAAQCLQAALDDGAWSTAYRLTQLKPEYSDWQFVVSAHECLIVSIHSHLDKSDVPIPEPGYDVSTGNLSACAKSFKASKSKLHSKLHDLWHCWVEHFQLDPSRCATIADQLEGLYRLNNTDSIKPFLSVVGVGLARCLMRIGGGQWQLAADEAYRIVTMFASPPLKTSKPAYDLAMKITIMIVECRDVCSTIPDKSDPTSTSSGFCCSIYTGLKALAKSQTLDGASYLLIQPGLLKDLKDAIRETTSYRRKDKLSKVGTNLLGLSGIGDDRTVGSVGGGCSNENKWPALGPGGDAGQPAEYGSYDITSEKRVKADCLLCSVLSTLNGLLKLVCPDCENENTSGETRAKELHAGTSPGSTGSTRTKLAPEFLHEFSKSTTKFDSFSADKFWNSPLQLRQFAKCLNANNSDCSSALFSPKSPDSIQSVHDILMFGDQPSTPGLSELMKRCNISTNLETPEKDCVKDKIPEDPKQGLDDSLLYDKEGNELGVEEDGSERSESVVDAGVLDEIYNSQLLMSEIPSVDVDELGRKLQEHIRLALDPAAETCQICLASLRPMMNRLLARDESLLANQTALRESESESEVDGSQKELNDDEDEEKDETY